MLEKEKLLEICQTVLIAQGLNDEIHQKRFSLEIKEIDAQNEYEYFLDLYNKKIQYPENQNNLLIPYLLGIVSDFDITKQPMWIYGDAPDIDSDYSSLELRDILKKRMAEL